MLLKITFHQNIKFVSLHVQDVVQHYATYTHVSRQALSTLAVIMQIITHMNRLAEHCQ